MRERARVRPAVRCTALLNSALVELRCRCGLTPREAADALGISLLQLARLESATQRIPDDLLGTLTAAIEGWSAPCEDSRG